MVNCLDDVDIVSKLIAEEICINEMNKRNEMNMIFIDLRWWSTSCQIQLMMITITSWNHLTNFALKGLFTALLLPAKMVEYSFVIKNTLSTSVCKAEFLLFYLNALMLVFIYFLKMYNFINNLGGHNFMKDLQKTSYKVSNKIICISYCKMLRNWKSSRTVF